MFDRRSFLSYIPIATTVGLFGITSKATSIETPETKGVGAIESLMRGHGLLSRTMIIFFVVKVRYIGEQATDPSLILKTTQVIHDYLSEFHEKMEEKYIFAPLEKANIHFSSIQELKIQHGDSYELCRRISDLAKAGKLNSALVGWLDDFTKMYRHHAAWEDTVIFPAFDDLEKKSYISELSATFESEEKRILGSSGFKSFLNQIADVEKQLGIYELSSSTPQLQ